MDIDSLQEQLTSRLIDFLARKPRTYHEVYAKALEWCRQNQVESSVAESLVPEILQRLTLRGYIDDRDYALTYISEQKRRSTPHGPLYIKNFLFKKGIPRPLITQVLSEFFPPAEERYYALNLARKLSTKRSGMQDKQKLANYLRRRGFRVDAVRYAIDRLHETD